MASETTLIRDALKVAEAIHQFASDKRWNHEDYHIFMAVNTEHLTLRITVVSKQYEGRTEEQEVDDFDEVMDFIEKKIPRGSTRFNVLSLVLTGMEGYSFYAIPRLGPDEIEIDEKLINNNDVSWCEPLQPKRAVKRAKQ